MDYDANDYIPEDYYAVGDEPPAEMLAGDGGDYGSGGGQFGGGDDSSAYQPVGGDDSGDVASGAIRIVNPPDGQASIAYTLNGDNFTIDPGSQQDLDAGQAWEIVFDRGGDAGTADYNLESGVYTFGVSDQGWELYHTSDVVQD